MGLFWSNTQGFTANQGYSSKERPVYEPYDNRYCHVSLILPVSLENVFQITKAWGIPEIWRKYFCLKIDWLAPSRDIGAFPVDVLASRMKSTKTYA